jgi:hypothetical protein
MKKGRMFAVLITIVMITISFTGCFGEDYGEERKIEVEPKVVATKDDIKIRLEYNNSTSDNNLNLRSTIENIRNYTIHLDGGFRLELIIENTKNKSDYIHQSSWMDNHKGETWSAYHQEWFLIQLFLTENESEKSNEYKIQHKFTFENPGSKSTAGILINSNIIVYNTNRQIIDTDIQKGQ